MTTEIHTGPTAEETSQLAVVVIGAGFSGLCMGAKLKAAGIDNFVILEKAPELGGTWRDNHYPGAACDVPACLYSLSFLQEGRWSRTYPGRDELLAYTHRVADTFDLRKHIRLSTALISGHFDEQHHCWTLNTNHGVITAQALVLATGPLSRPSIPVLAGMEAFKGKVFHSSQWDHHFDLSNKRVAVIGTGASAIQFVPQIAQQVEKLHIFQRTPPWILPRRDSPIGPLQSKLSQKYAAAKHALRFMEFCKRELLLIAFAKYPSLMGMLRKYALQHLRSQAPEKLWQALTPRYAPGCKRILLSDDYYATLHQPHVELVTESIQAFQDDAIVTASGSTRRVDLVIFGTGFDSDNLIGPIELYGKGGRSLQQLARTGLEAYKGVTISGFPNLFMLGGPNTGIGHTSLLIMIEASSTYAVNALKAIKNKKLRSVDVKPEAQQQFNQWIQKSLSKTVWNSGCHSWYLHRQNGKNQMIWPTFTFVYQYITHRFDLSNYLIS